MDNHTTILDESLSNETLGNHNIASAGKRFVNHLIDYIIIYLVHSTLVGVLIATSDLGYAQDTSASFDIIIQSYAIGFACFFLYFVICETVFKGKTIGKMASKTVVVSMDGTPPSFGQVIIRTICRIIPFEFISVWTSNGVMLHDSLAKTRVIRINE
jgi:uncharacterized RDD family membrane protein YckC